MDRTARRWPYAALAGALAAMVILAAAVSFDWLPSNDQQDQQQDQKAKTAAGDKTDDSTGGKSKGTDRQSSDASTQDGLLADPCSAVPKKVIADLMGDVTPVPNPQNQRDRVCAWTGPVEDDPDRIREVRITLHGVPNVDPTFDQMQQKLTGDDAYTKAKAPEKNNDKALAWTHQEPTAVTAGILLADDGTMATIEVLGSKYPDGRSTVEADESQDELLDKAQTIAGEVALPDKASVVERLNNDQSRIKTVHESPESPNACAVSDETLQQVIGDGYEKSGAGGNDFCGWSQPSEIQTDPSFSGLQADLHTSLHQMKDDPVGASVHGLEAPQGTGIEFASVQLFDTLGKGYGEPGDATVIVAHTTNRLPDGGNGSIARVALRVNDTTVLVVYRGYDVIEAGKSQEADPAVMKKNALAVAKDLVKNLS